MDKVCPCFFSLVASNGTSRLNICAFQCQHLYGTILIKFSTVAQKFHFCGAICDKFALYLVQIQQLLLRKLVLELHLIMVLFGTNLVSNISTKKKNTLNASLPFSHSLIYSLQALTNVRNESNLFTLKSKKSLQIKKLTNRFTLSRFKNVFFFIIILIKHKEYDLQRNY